VSVRKRRLCVQLRSTREELSQRLSTIGVSDIRFVAANRTSWKSVTIATSGMDAQARYDLAMAVHQAVGSSPEAGEWKWYCEWAK
jgi:hypothetical protein